MSTASEKFSRAQIALFSRILFCVSLAAALIAHALAPFTEGNANALNIFQSILLTVPEFTVIALLLYAADRLYAPEPHRKFMSFGIYLASLCLIIQAFLHHAEYLLYHFAPALLFVKNS